MKFLILLFVVIALSENTINSTKTPQKHTLPHKKARSVIIQQNAQNELTIPVNKEIHIAKTNQNIQTTLDNCQLYKFGYLRYKLHLIFFDREVDIGSVAVYKCDSVAWNKSMILTLKISYGLLQWIVTKAIDDVINKKENNKLIITESQIPKLKQLLESVSADVYTNTDIKITHKTGITTIFINGKVKKTANDITLQSLKQLMTAIKEYYVEIKM
jgi:hypothetical protein